MKIFSIVYQSTSSPEKIGMYSTAISNTIEEAQTEGLKRMNSDFGDANWKTTLTNVLDVNLHFNSQADTVIPKNPDERVVVETDHSKKQTENWLIGKIIENKDRKLFNASKKHFSKNEILYIEEKIK